MVDSLAAAGLPGLFLLSFLAATLLPLGSEWLLVLLLTRGQDPAAAVAVATVGNVLGAATTWAIGVWGGELVAERLLRISPAQRARAELLYARYGSWSLLFSWIPLLGDPLCLVGGLLKISLVRFFLLVLVGKGFRYSALALLTLGLAG